MCLEVSNGQKANSNLVKINSAPKCMSRAPMSPEPNLMFAHFVRVLFVGAQVNARPNRPAPFCCSIHINYRTCRKWRLSRFGTTRFGATTVPSTTTTSRDVPVDYSGQTTSNGLPVRLAKKYLNF